MKKIILWVGLGLLIGSTATAQKYVSDTGSITFFSDASIEDIKATNSKVTSLLNIASGDWVFSVPMTEFKFDKKLMEEHFNEKYVESEKYPKAIFSGKLIGFSPEATGKQQVRAVGKLSIHGVSKEIDVPGTIQVTDLKLAADARFVIKLDEYNIERPKILWKNIAEEVEVTVTFTYKPYEK
jgi:polyisoprenoid-binding protein YceI